MAMTYSVTLREDDEWVYGETRETRTDAFLTNWIRLKNPVWFTKPVKQILADIGIDCDERRALEFESLIDGDLSAFYYLSTAKGSTDGGETMKWIMGGLAAKLNETKQSFKTISTILPAAHLACFCEMLEAGTINRSFAKDIFADLLVGWRTGDPKTVLEGILASSRYQAVDNSILEGIIRTVFLDNPEPYAKLKAGDTKLFNWFVGQAMKSAKGKGDVQTIREMITAMTCE